MTRSDRSVPWLLWPFVAIWRLLTFLLAAAGRLVCGVVGFVLLVVGAVLTATIAGAPFGVPLAAVGILLLVRALF